MSLNHPLMINNITRSDLDELVSYLSKPNPRLTQGSNVKAFEKEWSEWLGVKYSVFVNSGSSANLITLAVIEKLYGKGEIIVPPLTWVSDIAACIHNGFDPVFADINPRNLCLDTANTIGQINSRTRAVFITHAQGFNGLTDRLLTELSERNIPLIEDVCEAHGATFKGRRLGSFGLMSNFSFYYAHHLSTIEGGMVCTNNEEIYEMLRMFRSHGLVREVTNSQVQEEYSKDNSSLNSEFIFAFPAYNVRNTELGAIIGRNQLKRLDVGNEKRIQNNLVFLEYLDGERFRKEYELEGSCNYAFNLVLREPDLTLRDRLEDAMDKSNVEYRRGSAGGGNQMRQPFLQDIVESKGWEKYPEVEHIHFYGWYIGNYPDLEEEKILRLCELLNNA